MSNTKPPKDDAAPAAVTLLGREAIRVASDLTTEDVAVPEWGGTVRVRALSGTERDAFEDGIVGPTTGKGKSATRKMNLQNVRARLVSLVLVDEQGERLFGTADVAWLGGKSAAALQRVFEVAQRLSGLTPEDVDELAGNSDADPSGSSTSA